MHPDSTESVSRDGGGGPVVSKGQLSTSLPSLNPHDSGRFKEAETKD